MPVTDYRAIEGWFNYEDVFDNAMQELTNRLQRRLRTVEIGAWLGKSSFYLVDRHYDKTDIFIVDTWQGSPEELNSTHKWALKNNIFIDFMKNMQIHQGKFTPLRCQSTEAACLFKEESIDFIFIDGDHTYDAVKADLDAWQPKLNKKGIIAGHDYHPEWPGVIKAVDEKYGPDNILVSKNSWIYKPYSPIFS